MKYRGFQIFIMVNLTAVLTLIAAPFVLFNGHIQKFGVENPQGWELVSNFYQLGIQFYSHFNLI